MPAKDQSYFLFELDQEQLAASLFPLGELTKDEVRALARAAGLLVAEKGESMETCFVLGIAAARPLYVLDIDAAANRVTVGAREQLRARGLVGGRVHWISGNAPQGPVEATVRIRSRHDGVDSQVRDRGRGGVEVEFSEPQVGVAPGQAAVFYRGTEVLGGCWIERPIR
jgi:tRNA-uridine 2-sulfurtransferase